MGEWKSKNCKVKLKGADKMEMTLIVESFVGWSMLAILIITLLCVSILVIQSKRKRDCSPLRVIPDLFRSTLLTMLALTIISLMLKYIITG